MLPLHIIIPAAGSGSRMGAGLPKLLLEIAGIPIIVRTLRAILSLDSIVQIIITAPSEYLKTYQDLLEPESNLVRVVVGGASRQESVKIALAEITKKVEQPEQELVLIHDGARCFVSEKVLVNAVSGAEKFQAITVAVPVVDSIKRVSADGVALESLKRSELWAVQTPQVFTYALLKQAHAIENTVATDDASLVERIQPVHIIEGERNNLKVTTPFDLQIATALLE